MTLRFHAPYMEWAKSRPAARYDLSISNILGCSLEDLPDAADAIALSGRNDNGYPPLLARIAAHYGVDEARVTTAQGASGANFLVFAALLDPGDDVLFERPGYDPLMGAARLVVANVVRFDRRFEDRYALDPDRVAAAFTPRTKLIVVTSPHNPSSAAVEYEALAAVGRLAAERGAYVLVDEVYADARDTARPSAAHLDGPFIVTNSLTKSYGLSGLRCGWVLSSPDLSYRLRRARDVVDGSGSVVAERLSVLAFDHAKALLARSRALLSVNAPILKAFLEARPELACVWPDGGTVAFPRLVNTDDASAFAERLHREFDTAVVPGRFFDAPAHVRIGFSGDTATLEEGLRRVGYALG